MGRAAGGSIADLRVRKLGTLNFPKGRVMKLGEVAHLNFLQAAPPFAVVWASSPAWGAAGTRRACSPSQIPGGSQGWLPLPDGVRLFPPAAQK
jgi:hypothetical protein